MWKETFASTREPANSTQERRRLDSNPEPGNCEAATLNANSISAISSSMDYLVAVSYAFFNIIDKIVISVV